MRFKYQFSLARQLLNQRITNAFQNQVIAYWGKEPPFFCNPYIRRRALSQITVTQLDGLARLMLSRILRHQHIAKQRNRFDIAMQPARIRRSGCCKWICKLDLCQTSGKARQMLLQTERTPLSAILRRVNGNNFIYTIPKNETAV